MCIQPFLRPLPPAGSEALATILAPVGYALGAVKTVLVLALALVYFVLVRGVCLVFVSVSVRIPVPYPCSQEQILVSNTSPS